MDIYGYIYSSWEYHQPENLWKSGDPEMDTAAKSATTPLLGYE